MCLRTPKGARELPWDTIIAIHYFFFRFFENQRTLTPTSLQDIEDSNHRLLSRSLTVQSSFQLEIPPYLIIPSSNIKLVETIGQGISYNTIPRSDTIE